MDWITSLFTGLFAGGGLVAIVAAVLKHLLDRRKLDVDERQEDDKLPIDVQKEIIADLRARINQLEAHIETLTKRFQDEIGELNTKLTETLRQLGRMEGVADELTRSGVLNREFTAKQGVQVLTLAGKVAERGIEVAAAKAEAESARSGISKPTVENPMPVKIVGQPVAMHEVDPKSIHE